MKKILLLLLLSVSIYGQTYSEISDLIDINLANGTKITAVKHREVEHALLNYIQSNLSQTGDIKRVKCDITYLNDNFEVDGLGKNLRLGWAICNGNNGTDNLAGRVGVGYGLGWSVLGQIGGEQNHTLTIDEIPSHTHTIAKATNDTDGTTLSPGNGSSGTVTSNATGGGNAHNNMQPYIINLYIMKL